MRVEPPLEDERGRLLIDHALALASRQIRVDQDPLGLRGGESLVLFVDRNHGSELAADRGDEFLDALRAMTDPARELERHPDYNVGDGMQCTQRDHSGCVTRIADPREHGERMRRNLGFVGQRDADRLAADIET